MEICGGVEQFEEVFKQLGEAIQDEKSGLEEDMVEAQVDLDDLMEDNVEWDVDESGEQTSLLLKELKKCYSRLEGYCKTLAVFGFNSAGYDIKLIKKYLFKELCRKGEEPSFTVKKGGKYPCIKTQCLRFMDILQFLAPGYTVKYFSCLWCERK